MALRVVQQASNNVQFETCAIYSITSRTGKIVWRRRLKNTARYLVVAVMKVRLISIWQFFLVKSTNKKISSAVKVPRVKIMHHVAAYLVYIEASKMEFRVAFLRCRRPAHSRH